MKKNYIEPKVRVLCVKSSPIAISGVATGDRGIGWGGYDTTGSQEADATHRRGIWDSMGE